MSRDPTTKKQLQSTSALGPTQSANVAATVKHFKQVVLAWGDSQLGKTGKCTKSSVNKEKKEEWKGTLQLRTSTLPPCSYTMKTPIPTLFLILGNAFSQQQNCLHTHEAQSDSGVQFFLTCQEFFLKPRQRPSWTDKRAAADAVSVQAHVKSVSFDRRV